MDLATVLPLGTNSFQSKVLQGERGGDEEAYQLFKISLPERNNCDFYSVHWPELVTWPQPICKGPGKSRGGYRVIGEH